MKAAAIKKYGKNEKLQFLDLPIPKVSDNDVLVEIHAASINPVDYKIKEGKLKLVLKFKFPLILGNDVAGTILEVGKNVKRFKVGDQIFARPRKSHIGAFAEYIAIDQEDISLKPKNISMEEAAGIPLVGLTSWQAMVEIAKIKPGQKVLIPAGSGGVGTFAIQLAKHLGASVTATTSEKNMDLVKSLGADHIINYRKEEFQDLPDRYDFVFDTLGGETTANALKVLKPGGSVVSISGSPTGQFAKQMGGGVLKQILFQLVGLKTLRLAKKLGVDYHFLFMRPSGEQLSQISRLIEQGKIRPVVDRIFPLDQINEAMAYVESGRAKGKVILKIKN